MFGMMTDVNIWDYPMSVKEMKDWIGCTIYSAGNVVDWTSAEWTLQGLQEQEMMKDTICKPIKPDLTIFPIAKGLMDFHTYSFQKIFED